jgi:hypothetical protein
MATITNEGGPYGTSGHASSSLGTAIATGNHGRTNLGKHYSAPIKDDAKFGKIKTISDGKINHLTGSLAGSSGFIVQTAGEMEIIPTEGDAIRADVVTAKTLYEIGVRQVSGSGTVHIIY